MEDELQIYGLTFKMTCMACPEQYDVFHAGKLVGYVRLRHGAIRANYPNIKGEVIYNTEYGGLHTGSFLSVVDRRFHLVNIASEINRALRDDNGN